MTTKLLEEFYRIDDNETSREFRERVLDDAKKELDGILDTDKSFAVLVFDPTDNTTMITAATEGPAMIAFQETIDREIADRALEKLEVLVVDLSGAIYPEPKKEKE